MLAFFNRNAGAVQAIAAILTVVLAAGALLGVKLQINAAEKSQKEQSARDIYREFLSLSISKPEFADPDYCTLSATAQAPAYENYVEYLLYTAEQTIAVDATWHDTFVATLKPHATYLCSLKDSNNYSENVQSLIGDFVKDNCAAVKQC